MSFVSEPQKLIFPTVITTSGFSPFPELNLTTGVLTTNWNFSSSSLAVFTIRINITPSVSSATIPYILYAYKDGVLYRTFTLTGTQTVDVDMVQRQNDPTLSHTYTFELSVSTSPFVYTSYVFYSRDTSFGSGSITKSQSFKGATSAISTINIGNYIPDIKVIDFITGIIKAFNLMIIPRENNTYEFLPLEMYYNAGKILDITEYTYENDMSVNKPKLFKSINFTYEESKNVLNFCFTLFKSNPF
jgi:hypothetical protein